MSTEIFEYSSRGHGVGVFAKSDGMGVYPENANVRDTPECNSMFIYRQSNLLLLDNLAIAGYIVQPQVLQSDIHPGLQIIIEINSRL